MSQCSVVKGDHACTRMSWQKYMSCSSSVLRMLWKDSAIVECFNLASSVRERRMKYYEAWKKLTPKSTCNVGICPEVPHSPIVYSKGSAVSGSTHVRTLPKRSQKTKISSVVRSRRHIYLVWDQKCRMVAAASIPYLWSYGLSFKEYRYESAQCSKRGPRLYKDVLTKIHVLLLLRITYVLERQCNSRMFLSCKFSAGKEDEV